MKKIDVDPTLAAATEVFYGKLTTPDSEDWTVIPAGDQVHITALREIHRDGKLVIAVRYGTAAVKEFRDLVKKLPANHDLGCVSVILSRDHEAMGGVNLLNFLSRQARRRNFSLTSMIGAASTAEAIRSVQMMHAQFEATPLS